VTDSLHGLIVDESTVARDELAAALSPYVRFTGDGRLLLEPAFDELSADRKVVCVLLAFQALAILELRDDASATPAEIVELSGMPAGTVRPKLSALLKQRRVAKTADGYTLPLHAARRAADLLRTRT
jgi:hypothetical protein